MKQEDKLTEKFGIIANSFDHNVLSVLAMTSDEGYVTNNHLRYSLNLLKSEISEVLKLMTQKGLLVTEGYGKGMRYHLPPNSLNVFREESEKMATSEENMATLEGKCGNLETSNMATLEGKSGNLESSNMATYIKKKMSRDELQNLILKNCQEWISLDELADAIDRNAKYLRNQIMPIMVASKIIQMMYPTNPNHPQQRYKVSD